MIRVTTAVLVVSLLATGAAPCPASAGPATPPDRCAAMGMTTGMPPAPARTPADCCVVSADPRVPPPAPVASGHFDVRLLAESALAPVPLPMPVARVNDREARARSADRPPIPAVLLI